MTDSLHDFSVSVVLPVFNEEAQIGDLVRRIRKIGPDYEIIIVDDGSSDNTRTEAENAGATIISHPYNVGNGASVKRGCLQAKGDIIVLLDADGQHPPEEIPKLITHMADYDMCVAARTKHSQTSAFRNFGNAILNALGGWVTGNKIDDLTSGFRAIRRNCLYEYIHLFPKRYSYPTTITIAMMQGNHFVKYIPMDSIQSRKTGTSNIRPFHDFIRFVSIMLRVLILFSPNRFFLPLSLLTFMAGVCLSLYQWTVTGGIQAGGVMLMISTVIFFCFGLLADQIADIRRSKNEASPFD